MSSLAQQN